MEATPLASLSLTHVHYNPADPLSYLCAWLALVPQALCVIYATLIWSTREVEILLMFVGQMGCEALNFLLKRAIKEERPKRTFAVSTLCFFAAGEDDGAGYGERAAADLTRAWHGAEMNGKGYGMPSSHAQFLTYFSLSLSLFLLRRHQPPPSMHKDERPYSHKPLNLAQKLFLSFGAFVLAAAVAASRIYLSYHTRAQVVAGCVAGGVSAGAWFAVTEWLRREGWVEWGLDCWVGRMGRWRDLAVEEDLPEAGWRVWEERRRKRRVNGIGEKKSR